MGLFPFGRKLDIAKEYSLEEMPVFSALTPSEQKLIEKKARLVEFKRGDIVYEEGAPAEAFYVVIFGRFRLFSRSKSDGNQQTLIFFGRGDHFSETSLLTEQPHSASVDAKSDGLLLKLDKKDFLSLIKEIPAISLYLNRSLGRRLTQNLGKDPKRRQVKIAALYTVSHPSESFQFWQDFAGKVGTETKNNVVIVDFFNQGHLTLNNDLQVTAINDFDFSKMDPSRAEDLKPCLLKHPKGFDYIHIVAEDADGDEKKFATLLTFLTYHYEFLMLRLPPELSSAFKVLKRSDMVYLYAASESGGLEEYAQTIQDLQQSFSFGQSEIRVILPTSSFAQGVSYEEKENVLGTRIFSVIPNVVEQPERYQSVIRFLARELAGVLLGLALGSGAAYGLAHIGVMRVLEREGIMPDIISGSSIGALVGGYVAAGFSVEELEGVAKSIDKKTGFFRLIGFRDFSAAHRGFFKGDQVSRFLSGYLGNRTFQDLKIPLKIVATNLFTSEEVIMDTGRVVDAIRASCSIPGIFRPYRFGNMHLIDGGVIDPLPVRTLTRMGVKKIIAVNVLPGPKDRIERNRLRQSIRDLEQQKMEKQNVLSRLFSRGVDKVYNRYAVNIFNVIMSTIQFMEYEIAETWGDQADILIHPIVKEAHWAEFYSPEKFIKVGEEKTLEQLDEIRRLIHE